jgi:8-oxo-dGTP pyrophosphatase MutT (NUDIX family)
MTDYQTCIPYVGGIIERTNNGETEVFVQTRWKPERDPIYSGTLEFPVGVLDKPYENVLDALSREIKEETGLNLKTIKNEDKTAEYSSKMADKSLGRFVVHNSC